MKKEEFEPINPPNVTFYVCGPTVYDYFHIGNGRSFIASDMIRRYLIYKGYKVKFLMNLTDIDDKIIKKSIEEKTDPGSVTNRYIEAFFEDIISLFSAQISERRLDLVISYVGDVPQKIIIDPVHLRKVFINLIGNFISLPL